MKRTALAGLCAAMLLQGWAPAALGAEKAGVYVKVTEGLALSIDETVERAGQALSDKGWRVVASHAVTADEGCARAHTLVLDSPEYAGNILAFGPRGAFALPLRVGFFEEPAGVSVAYLNPVSINRTVLGDGVGPELSRGVADALSATLSTAVGGERIDRQIGQLRGKGRVGGMGGGDFEGKVEIIHERDDGEGVLAETAGKVAEAVAADQGGWKLIYALEYPERGVRIVGMNKGSMEAKAYDIAGEKRETREWRCPGTDHAAAFPIEVVIFREEGRVKVAILDEMYRMKVYFEDAGKWAFMKNMAMPGQIEDEIESLVLSLLGK